MDGSALRALVCAMFLVLSVRAGADVAVYQVVVPVAGTSEADRDAAFGDALRAAAVRASGQRDAGSSPVIDAAAADPARYVQQYSTTADHRLKVGFDARAMDRLLQQARLPFWPVERPVTVVLLVVPSVLASERVPERLEVERAALARGLPIAWPQVPVGVAQVREALAGNRGAAAAEAWGGKALLAGVGSGQAIAWSYAESGQAVRADGGLQAGVDLAADTLAARYAPPSSRGTSSVAIRVSGIKDVSAYAGLMDYLASLSLVRAVNVQEVSGSVLSLDVTLRGDMELLRRVAGLDGHLVAAAASGTEGSPGPDFNYVP
jgi:hypothetical protein